MYKMANRKLKAHPLSDVASLTGKSEEYYFWLNWETLAIFKVERGLTCIGFLLKLGTPGYLMEAGLLTTCARS